MSGSERIINKGITLENGSTFTGRDSNNYYIEAKSFIHQSERSKYERLIKNIYIGYQGIDHITIDAAIDFRKKLGLDRVTILEKNKRNHVPEEYYEKHIAPFISEFGFLFNYFLEDQSLALVFSIIGEELKSKYIEIHGIEFLKVFEELKSEITLYLDLQGIINSIELEDIMYVNTIFAFLYFTCFIG